MAAKERSVTEKVTIDQIFSRVWPVVLERKAKELEGNLRALDLNPHDPQAYDMRNDIRILRDLRDKGL